MAISCRWGYYCAELSAWSGYLFCSISNALPRYGPSRPSVIHHTTSERSYFGFIHDAGSGTDKKKVIGEELSRNKIHQYLHWSRPQPPHTANPLLLVHWRKFRRMCRLELHKSPLLELIRITKNNVACRAIHRTIKCITSSGTVNVGRILWANEVDWTILS